MKFLITFKNVKLDVNGGEYTSLIQNELYLGIIEVDTFEEALKLAEELANKSYEKHGGENAMGYPELVTTNLDEVETLSYNKFEVTYEDYDGEIKKVRIEILNNYRDIYEDEEIYNFMLYNFDDFKEIKNTSEVK